MDWYRADFTNVLYLLENNFQRLEYKERILKQLTDSHHPCKIKYDFYCELKIQTKYATLYVKSVDDTLFSILPKFNYYACGIDFTKIAKERLIKIQGLINNSISIKYAKDAEKINADEILGILMGGKYEH
jgi:hypothetical protein